MAIKLFRLTAVFCFLCAAQSACAFFNILDIPETVAIREKILETWLTAPVSELKDKKSEFHRSNSGRVFQVRFEDFGSSIAIVVSPRQADYSFPLTAPGSWVLYRDAKTGSPQVIRFYFQTDQEVYAQFRVSSPKNVIDFVVFGAYAVRNAPVELSIDRLYMLSFAETVRMTAPILPWQYARIDPRLYYYNLFMIAVIRENLPFFTYTTDAGYNEYGKPVFIDDGSARVDDPGKLGVNCSGFVKWITDGLIEPVTGGFTKIGPLKESTVSSPGLWAQTTGERGDVFFGLDWCRNLGAAAVSIDNGSGIRVNATEADVNDNYFSAFSTQQGIQRTEGYVADAGYSMELIKPLLYVSAALYPDRFYLAAVRTGDPATPDKAAFSHTAALFPYFDSMMQLRIVVFESGMETDFEDFADKNAGAFVHLTKIKSSDRFFPLQPSFGN